MSRTRLFPESEWTTDWSVGSAPAVNTQATVTQPAPGGGKRLVATGLVVTLIAGGTTPAAGTVTVGILDGASGSPTYLWGPVRLGVQALAGSTAGVARASLFLVGSANTPMTLEFSGAAGANTFESVVLEGTTINA